MLQLDIATITDAPTTLAAVKASWVQLAQLGAYEDPRYGKFKIAQADFNKWLANFVAYWSPSVGREGIPIDVDHGPEKRGDTEAAGWVTKLEQRGAGLWGCVEWTDLGRELVSSRRYVYLSPSYAHDWKDSEGVSHGTALVGVGLTNRPFLRMATVTLCAASPFAEPVTDKVQIAPGDMALLDDLKAKLAQRGITLAADAAEADAIAALDALSKPQPADTRTLTEQLKAEGMVVMSATDHVTLQAQAAAGQAAAEELRTQKFELAFDKALSEGRITPAQKDTFKGIYATSAEATLSALEALPVILTVDSALGHTGGGGGDPEISSFVADAKNEGNALDEDRARVAAKVDQILAAEPDTDYMVAVNRAMADLGVSL